MIDLLFETPKLTITEIQEKLEITFPTAKSLVELFAEKNVLTPVIPDQKRNRSYLFTEYLNILSEGTELESSDS